MGLNSSKFLITRRQSRMENCFKNHLEAYYDAIITKFLYVYVYGIHSEA